MKTKLPYLGLLLKRLLLAYALMLFCRILFFVVYFKQFSAQSIWEICWAFICGFWFDSSAIAYFLSVTILLQLFPTNYRNKKTYQLISKVFFTFGIALLLLLNLIDVGYFAISGKRSGFEMIAIQSNANISPLSYVVSYWPLTLLLIVLIVIAWRIYPKQQQTLYIKTASEFLRELLLFFLVSLITFIGARGSLGLKPLNTLDAAKIAGAELMPLTLNTPFQLLMTIEQVGVHEKNYMHSEKATQYFNPYHTVSQLPTASNKNVVLIILESIGKEYVGFYNNGKGYTPFIDSLMQHSTVYVNAYANGKRSIEGIPAILAAMPSWMPSDYINSYYQTNKLYSTGYYLQKQGYNASFYHGGKNGTMSFDRFVASTQAGSYFGLNQYPNTDADFDGNWGIYDEPYLQYVAGELTKKEQPFYSTVFTLSSHHPYKLPDKHKQLFKKGTLPIHATISYTDFALKCFFETAQTKPWYNNTLFVITADHSSENETPYYQTQQGKYAIPLLVFEPTQTNGSINTQTIDHLGIMPLILNKTLPLNSQFFSFGSNYAVQYDGGIYQIIDYPFALTFDGEKNVGFYNLTNDSLMQQNLINQKILLPNITQKLDSMEQTIKAIIQQYNYALIHNKTH